MRYTFDSREIKPGMGFVALKGEKVDGHDFIPKALAAGAVDIIDGLRELQERAHAYRSSLKAKVIGVTGSAGKTTTKEFLRTFLSCVGKTHATEGNFNNHIGLPLTILNCPEGADFLVVEMGTNHPGEIAKLCDIAEPDVGVVTNIGTAHLEFFLTQQGIATEKGELIRRAKLGFTARDNKFIPGDVDVDQTWMADALSNVLPGQHNVANACLAFSVAEHFGCSHEMAVEALKSFSLPGARWRKIEKWGATFVDDTYNANPDSMLAALGAFHSMNAGCRHIAVLGDMFELGEDSLALHHRVFDAAKQYGFSEVIAVGAQSSQCDSTRSFADAEQLKLVLPSIIRPNDLILLKASHSMRLGDVLK